MTLMGVKMTDDPIILEESLKSLKKDFNRTRVTLGITVEASALKDAIDALEERLLDKKTGYSKVTKACLYLEERGYVVLNKEDWIQTEKDADILNYLLAYGVDNWEGYDDAMMAYHEGGDA